MISEDAAEKAVLKLAVLPFFPAEPTTRGVIFNELMELCSSDEQVDWLVKRTIKLWTKWESLRELRAIFCAKFKPADGFEVGYSQVFADGIVPPESPEPSYTLPALPPGATASADPEMDRLVTEGAKVVEMPAPPRMSSEEFHRAVAQKNDWRGFNDRNERQRLLVDMITAPPDRRPLAATETTPVAPFKQITAEDIQRAQAELAGLREQRIQSARETLANPNATKDEKFIALETLKGLSA